MIPLKSLTLVSVLSLAPLMTGCEAAGQLKEGEPSTPLANAMVGSVSDVQFTNKPPTGDPNQPSPVPKAQACVGPGLTVPVERQKDCYWALKNLIDNAYRRYKINLLHTINNTNFFADTLTEGLSVAGAITPGTAAKSLFSALAGGATAEKGFFSSDILYKQTVTIIINEMDTDRADVSTNNKQDIVDLGNTYPDTGAPKLAWGQVVNDLLAYYEAGTFQHAVVSLDSKAQNSSTSDKANADAVAGAVADAMKKAQADAAPPKAGKAKAAAAELPAPIILSVGGTKNSGDRRNFTANGKPVN